MLPTFYLPAELWLYIHRSVVPNLEPRLDDSPDKALCESDMKENHQAVCALSQVCKLWSQLAHELVYENVCVNDRFASLTAALDRPDTARLVRRIRLSPNRYDHNRTILRQCTKVELVVQPECPRSDCRDVGLGDASLLALPNLRHLYWMQSRRSSDLLQSVLNAAGPALTHIALSTSWRIGTDPNWSPTLPSSLAPNLSSLVLTRLTPPCTRAFVQTADLTHLESLTIDPMYFRCPHFPVLPSVRVLKLVAPTELPWGRIFEACPNMRELAYDVRSRIDHERGSGVELGTGGDASALVCVRLTLPPAAPYTAGRGRTCECEFNPRLVEAHLRFLVEEKPMFAKLRRVVLDGAGWPWARGSLEEIGMQRMGKGGLNFEVVGRLRDQLGARGGELELALQS